MLLDLLFEQFNDLLCIGCVTANPDRGQPERCRRGNRGRREARKPLTQAGKFPLSDELRHQVCQQACSTIQVASQKSVLTGFFTPLLLLIPGAGPAIELWDQLWLLSVKPGTQTLGEEGMIA